MDPRQGRLDPNIVNNDVWAQSGPDGDPWRPKADFWEAEGRRWGVWGRSPQQNGALWGSIGGRRAFFFADTGGGGCWYVSVDRHISNRGVQ